MRKVLILTFTLWLLPACRVQADVIYSTWIGEDGDWGTASNWDPAIVPDNNGSQSFVVTIDGGSGDKKQIGLSQSRTIDELDCYGNVWLESHTPYDLVLTLVDANGLTNHGNLRIRGRGAEAHQFKVCGSVRNESGSILEFFRVCLSDNFYNASGATAEVIYVNDFPSGLRNDGVMIVFPGGEMSADANIINTGQIQIFGGTCAATGLLDNDVNGVIDGFGVAHSGQQSQNTGAIYASGGSLVLHTDSSLTNTGTLSNKPSASLHIKPSEDVNNNGTIEVNAGGGVAFDCNMVNEPNGVIKLLGGTLAATTIMQAADANFEGFGGITGDVFIEPNGIIKLTGPTNIVGDVNIPANATLEISDGQTLITGQTTCDGTIHLIGGMIVFQGGCDCSGCNIINEAGIDRNHFDINADGIEDFKDFAVFAEDWLWQASWY